MSWQCEGEGCKELNDDLHEACWRCKRPRHAGPGWTAEAASAGSKVVTPCSTTMEIPGRNIRESKGLVFGEAILGNNIFRDIAASVRDIVGGRSGAYESNLRRGRQIAIDEMIQEARALGADAVVGVDVDYETVGAAMLMICASGTAVVLEGEVGKGEKME